MKKYISIHAITITIISTVFIMASCEEEMIGPEKANAPTSNFEYFWKTFDTHYGLFDVKKVDWKAVYDEFRPKVNDQMTDTEFYKVLSDVIVLLNDNHLNLYPTNGELPVFPGGVLSYRNGVLNILKVQEDYDLEVVKKYVTDYRQMTPNIGVGKLPEDIVYINLKGTDGMKDVEKAMENVMAQTSTARGVVIDIRGFYGGFDPVSQKLAGYFAPSEEVYMITKKRNGPLHTDFTETMEWRVRPQGRVFTGPVVLLTSRFTQSAGETFTLALKEFDHVRIAGDTTAGSFSDNPNFEMYNGWIFSVSVGDYRDANGNSYEGTGIAPDFTIVNTKADLLNQKDNTLQKAVEMMQ